MAFLLFLKQCLTAWQTYHIARRFSFKDPLAMFSLALIYPRIIATRTGLAHKAQGLVVFFSQTQELDLTPAF